MGGLSRRFFACCVDFEAALSHKVNSTQTILITSSKFQPNIKTIMTRPILPKPGRPYIPHSAHPFSHTIYLDCLCTLLSAGSARDGPRSRPSRPLRCGLCTCVFATHIERQSQGGTKSGDWRAVGAPIMVVGGSVGLPFVLEGSLGGATKNRGACERNTSSTHTSINDRDTSTRNRLLNTVDYTTHKFTEPTVTSAAKPVVKPAAKRWLEAESLHTKPAPCHPTDFMTSGNVNCASFDKENGQSSLLIKLKATPTSPRHRHHPRASRASRRCPRCARANGPAPDRCCWCGEALSGRAREDDAASLENSPRLIPSWNVPLSPPPSSPDPKELEAAESLYMLMMMAAWSPPDSLPPSSPSPWPAAGSERRSDGRANMVRGGLGHSAAYPAAEPKL